VFSQSDDNKVLQEVEFYDVGFVSISPYYPIAVGNNFANNAQETNLGAQLESRFIIADHILVGARINIFSGQVTNPELIGNYDLRNVNLIGVEAGYRYSPINNFHVSFLAGISAIEYRNALDGERFEDNGEAYSLIADADYKFSRHFSAFLSTEYRYESLNTKAPSSTSVAFNNAAYLALSFGIRYYFLNERD
jgi:hypothetical protein